MPLEFVAPGCAPGAAWQNRWANQETDEDYRKKFLVEPGHKVKLDDLDPGYTGKHISEDRARNGIEKSRVEMAAQQYLLYAEKKHALLIVLQGMDAAGMAP